MDAVDKVLFTIEKDDLNELNCPVCKNVQMEHFNYGETSGIILHKCTKCSGIWMNKDELKKTEELVDGWKADLNQDTDKFCRVLAKGDIEEKKQLDQAISIFHIGFVNKVLRRFCEQRTF